jgi:hypothetical protein
VEFPLECNAIRLSRRLVAWFALAVAAAIPPFAVAAESAGTVMAATGDVQVLALDGKGRRVARGDSLNQGDRIVTGGNGLLQVRMADGSYLSVRSNTEMALDRFEVDAANNHKGSSFLISLVKGGLRAITGLIGRSNPDAYKVKTPTATIGVRGTDHEPMYIPDASPVFSALGAPGVYDKVNDGESYIQSAAGIVALKVGQIGHVGKAQEVPVILKTVPSFYRVDVKVDARPKEDLSSRKSLPTVAKPVLLRPTVGSRVATPASKLGAPATSVIGGATTLDPKLTTTTTLSTTTKEATTTLTSPTLSTSTLSTTTLTSPTLSTTTVSPTTTTTISPTLSTSTLSTTTLTSPTLSTTTISPTTTTTISPTLSTSTLSTTTLTSPTLSTTTISPTTTTISPTLTTSPTLTSPTLTPRLP